MTKIIEPMATGTVVTLSKTLREWHDFSDEPTGEVKEMYAEILNCIDQMDAGESIINGRQGESALIWATVNFINSLDESLEDEYRKSPLEELICLSIMVIRHMSNLTYWEILSLFPVHLFIRNEDGSYKVDADNYFDGSDIYFDENDGDFNSPSLSSLNLLTLCGCRIHFGDETEGTTDFDAKVGDGIMEYIMNNRHPVLRRFYSTFTYATYSLNFCK